MTAQPVGSHVLWSPDPMRQRLAGHTVEDVLTLQLPFSIELDIRDITP
jgi:hypothetical protein